MAEQNYIELLKLDVSQWNKWREANIEIAKEFDKVNYSGLDLIWADLSNAKLSEANLIGANLIEAKLISTDLSRSNLIYANLRGADLRKANLTGADLSEANLYEADLNSSDLSGANMERADLRRSNLRRADLRGANLRKVDLRRGNLNRANLRRANLSNADLRGADLSKADLSNSDLSGADLREVNLSNCNFVDTTLKGTDISGCCIYGISVWNIETDEYTKQKNLIITPKDESTITVDNLEVAQFIYLMLNNQKIREIINTLTSKVVLILGRFTPERKPVLDAIKEELRLYNLTPVLFDFDKPDDRNFIETVSTLAHIARFVIADFTEPKIVLQEAQHIIPNIVIPFAPIFLNGSGFEPVTLYDLRKGRTTVLDTFCYTDQNHLLENLYDKIVKPAEALAGELNKKHPLKI